MQWEKTKTLNSLIQRIDWWSKSRDQRIDKLDERGYELLLIRYISHSDAIYSIMMIFSYAILHS